MRKKDADFEIVILNIVKDLNVTEYIYLTRDPSLVGMTNKMNVILNEMKCSEESQWSRKINIANLNPYNIILYCKKHHPYSTFYLKFREKTFPVPIDSLRA